MKSAREFYDAVIDCEGSIQGTLLIEARDQAIRELALQERDSRKAPQATRVCDLWEDDG